MTSTRRLACRRIRTALICVVVFALPSTSDGQSAADSAAIRGTALDYIEGWSRYTRRLHSSLGYLSPADYEQRLTSVTLQQTAA
jgi:transposase InsO family protein